jgi:hypothetical protein
MTPTTALEKALDANDRLQGRLEKINKQAKAAGKRALAGGVAFLGGMTPGLLRGVAGDQNTGELKIPKMDVDVDMALGAAAGTVGLLGVFGLGDDMADYLAIYGGSVGGAALGRELEEGLLARRRAS